MDDDLDARIRSGKALSESMGNFHVTGWDPERKVLLDRNLLDNGWRSADPSFTDGVGDETFALFGGLLEVLF